MSVQLIITKDNTAVLDKEAKHACFDEVLKRWENRSKFQGFKEHHKATKEKKVEFLMGAVAALDYLAQDDEQSQITPKILFGIMQGVENLKPDQD